jgi:hypothetical protein
MHFRRLWLCGLQENLQLSAHLSFAGLARRDWELLRHLDLKVSAVFWSDLGVLLSITHAAIDLSPAV